MKILAKSIKSQMPLLSTALLIGVLVSPTYAFERDVSLEHVTKGLGLQTYNDLKIGETTGVFSSNLCWDDNNLFIIASAPIDEFATRISITRLDKETVEMEIAELPTEAQINTLKRHFLSIFNGFSCEGMRNIASPTPSFLTVKTINGYKSLGPLLEGLK